MQSSRADNDDMDMGVRRAGVRVSVRTRAKEIKCPAPGDNDSVIGCG